VHPYSAEGVNFIVCDAAAAARAERRAKAERLNLSLLCERARNFVATNMNFQSRPLCAHSIPIHGTRVPHADLWPGDAGQN
jgi:hypothetical protein